MNEYIFNYKQYKQKLNTNKNNNLLVLFLVIVLLMSAIVFINQNVKNTSKFYFIQIDEFLTYNSARNFIESINQNNKKFYIFSDTKYHIFSQAFSNKKLANTNLDTIKKSYPNSKIFTLEFSFFYNQKQLTKIENNLIKNFYIKTKKIILKVEQIISDFYSSKVDINDTKIKLQNCVIPFREESNNIIKSLSKTSKLNLVESYILNIQNSVESLIIFDANMLSLLNYEFMNFIVSYYHFSSYFDFSSSQ